MAFMVILKILKWMRILIFPLANNSCSFAFFLDYPSWRRKIDTKLPKIFSFWHDDYYNKFV